MATYKIFVKDSKGEPLAGATVSLLDKDKKQVGTSEMTGDDGGVVWQDNTASGYFVKVTMAGMNEQILPVADLVVAIMSDKGNNVISACAGKYRKGTPGNCSFDWSKFLKEWWWAFMLVVVVLIAVTVLVTRSIKK